MLIIIIPYYPILSSHIIPYYPHQKIAIWRDIQYIQYTILRHSHLATRMAFHAKGSTPLMQAVMGGQWEAAAALVARGARIDARNAQLGG